MVDMKALELNNIHLSYHSKGLGRRVLIDALNLSAMRGEVLALVGANGAGKSSLLRIISGVQAPTQGEIRWQGKALPQIDMASRPRYLAALFRGYARPDGFTVRELVALGRQPYSGFFGILSAIDNQIIENAIGKVGMASFAEAQIGTLSDGELQKVMIAKMLAQDAPIMVLDEPGTHLDLPSAIDLLYLLRRLARDEGKTVIFSTHNLGISFKLVDRILLLTGNGEWAEGNPLDISQHHHMCSFLRSDRIRFENGELHFDLKENEN
jgi:iron complex transport system ATP-binding protein